MVFIRNSLRVTTELCIQWLSLPVTVDMDELISVTIMTHVTCQGHSFNFKG